MTALKKHVHDGDPPSKEVAERRRQAILARHVNSELNATEITEFLNDTAAVVREAALATVVKLNLDAGKHIVSALNDDDHGVRKRAVELVIDLSDNHKYISEVLGLLDDSSTFVVETVCWVIGEIGNNYKNVAEIVSN